MKQVRWVTTPEEAEQALERKLQEADRVWDKYKASENDRDFQKYRGIMAEYRALRAQFMRKGLV